MRNPVGKRSQLLRQKSFLIQADYVSDNTCMRAASPSSKGEGDTQCDGCDPYEATDDASDHAELDDDEVDIVERLSVRIIVDGCLHATAAAVGGSGATFAVLATIRLLALVGLRRLPGLDGGRALGTISTW